MNAGIGAFLVFGFRTLKFDLMDVREVPSRRDRPFRRDLRTFRRPVRVLVDSPFEAEGAELSLVALQVPRMELEPYRWVGHARWTSEVAVRD
jgi:hypothetical protein